MRTTALPFLALIAACSTAVGPEADLLVREHWEWQRACCSIAGAAMTRAASGADYVLVFGRDGRVTATRNDTLLAATGYRVELSTPDDTGDQLRTVIYDEPLPLLPGVEPAERHAVFLTEHGVLLLRNPRCADCYGDWEFFARLVQ